MKKLLTVICAVLLLAACKKDKTEPTPTLPDKRTVIVYMPAETNLNSFANDDVNEMKKGIKDVVGRYNLLIFVDHASETQMPFIAKITSDTQHPVDTLYKYTEDFYSSDADHFREVLSRCMSLCPAENYGLVLWGHASGWIIERNGSLARAPRRAYGIDNGDNSAVGPGGNDSYKWMQIPEMREALEQLGIKFKFIFCDCCNMQSVETAYELRNCTEYFIASPAEITGVGAPYDTMVKDFFKEDDSEMCVSMCQDYNAQYDYVGGHLPISAVQTDKLEDLATATQQVLPQVADYLKTDNPTEGKIYYYAYNKNYEREKVMYDMYGMIRAALTDYPDAFKDWNYAFDQAVFYTETSEKWHANAVNFDDFTVTPENYGGMSMFFPMDKYKNTSHKYNDAIKLMQWYQAVGWSAVGW